MSFLAYLSNLKNNFRRRDHWDDLIQGQFLAILKQSAETTEDKDLAGLKEELKQWKSLLENKNLCSDIYVAQYAVIQNLLSIAEKAMAQPENPPQREDFKDYTAWEWDVFCYLVGHERKEAREKMRVKIYVLLVDSGNKRGMAARLVVELIEIGTGKIYPSPGKMTPFIIMDRSFLKAIINAKGILKKGSLWPENSDIRWYIEDLNGQPLSAPHLTGGSMGGAFLLVLNKLFDADVPDLEDFAVTAEIDENGDFHPVGGLWAKIGAVLEAPSESIIVKNLIRKILVSKDQKDIPPEYLGPDAMPQVIPLK